MAPRRKEEEHSEEQRKNDNNAEKRKDKHSAQQESIVRMVGWKTKRVEGTARTAGLHKKNAETT